MMLAIYYSVYSSGELVIVGFTMLNLHAFNAMHNDLYSQSAKF